MKVGDKVLIKGGYIYGQNYKGVFVTREMVDLAGKITVVTEVDGNFNRLDISNSWWHFDMLENINYLQFSTKLIKDSIVGMSCNSCGLVRKCRECREDFDKNLCSYAYDWINQIEEEKLNMNIRNK